METNSLVSNVSVPNRYQTSSPANTASPPTPNIVMYTTPVTATDDTISNSNPPDNMNICDGFPFVSSLRKRKTPQDSSTPRKEKVGIIESETPGSFLSDQTMTSNRYESLAHENADSLPVPEMCPQNPMEVNYTPSLENMKSKTVPSPSRVNEDELHRDSIK